MEGTTYRDDGVTWNERIYADPAVGVAGLRTLGTGALQAAVGSHGHTFTEDVSGENFTGGSNDGTFAFFVTKATGVDQDTDVTPTMTESGRMAGFGTIDAIAWTGGSSPDTFELFIDGVSIETATLSNSADREIVKGSRSVASGGRLVRVRFNHVTDARDILQTVAGVGIII